MTSECSAEILAALSAREPIFHRREWGTTREALERMTDDSFWEIGASGAIYSREFVIGTLLARYAAGPEDEELSCRDFTLQQIAADVFLISYTLSEPDRTTRRSTLWRRSGPVWKIVFHQGTVIRA